MPSLHNYEFDDKYKRPVAYFSMEFALHQALKTYSGGLGFLAGSHMRSAFELKQNIIGIGMLWKYGYYDQVRTAENDMEVLFQRKYYTYLEDTGIMVPVLINKHQVYVKALLLRPEVFNTAPMIFLTTDIEENDYLARTITHRLYDADTAARIAANIVLGIGGARVLDAMGLTPEIYHMNEAHALPLAFYLYGKFKTTDDVKQRLVFTTHTPEKAGNEEHDINLLDKMNFFGNVSLADVRRITGIEDQVFSHSLAALRLAKIANGVSQLHGVVAREMWGSYPGICKIKAITNAQNQTYWADHVLERAYQQRNLEALAERKTILKNRLIQTIADQTGKLFDADKIIIVWARRFAEYKRADLIKRDIARFSALVRNTDRPVQIVWAGKPYPGDLGAISVFNHLVKISRHEPNLAVLTGYELNLSAVLKKGADVWLNTPRRPREASGTSGMTAAMNAAINFTINDGWIPEFARHGENSYVIPAVDPHLPMDEQDNIDATNLMDILENQLLPCYYENPQRWAQIVLNSMADVRAYFDSGRMADEYYKLYNDQDFTPNPPVKDGAAEVAKVALS